MQINPGKIKVIPAKTKKLIYQEANSTCPFCGERDVNVFELHHIESRAAGGNNEPENLILVCSNCHSKITEGVISRHEVHKAKANMQRRSLRRGAARSTSNVIQFERSINQGIVANNLRIVAPRRSIRIGPPSGTIAANRDMRNYVKYLIDRYNEFKKADASVEAFRYSVIYQSIKREFKCKWDYIPIEKFPLLVEYLQRRIDKTILGKVNKSRGKRRYSTFEEYTADL
ncbi:MAG: hypothetical protein QOJ64_4282 [Acidobacteriota bacterium]|jgi:hypothetical protein|nr:hypothetical protein [Acidobacteriota bacterium]